MNKGLGYRNSQGYICIQLTNIAIQILVFTILVRTLNSRGNKFVNFSENYVLPNISESTVLEKGKDKSNKSIHEHTCLILAQKAKQ